MNFSDYLTDVLSAQPKMTTETGKPVSHFSMQVYFNQPKPHLKWSYRGDLELSKLLAAKRFNQSHNQLQALIFKLSQIQENVRSVKIWNNFNSPLTQLIYCEGQDGRVSINLLTDELSKLKK